MTCAVYAFVAGLGACLGSFLNVVIYRLPLDKSIIRPGSSCPKCEQPIKWYDNIPIFSYLILHARCRNCKTKIAIRYPLVETTAMILSLVAFHIYGLSLEIIPALIMSLGMVAVAFIDYDHMIIPDELSIGGTVAGILLALLPGGVSPIDAIIGALVGGAGLWLVRWVHMKISGIEGMGLGDVKLACAIGAFLGWFALPVVLFLSSMLGLLVGGTAILVRKKNARTPMPFGTFLALGSIFDVLFGDKLRAMFMQLAVLYN